MSEPKTTKNFFRYIITPRGHSANLVIAFLVVLIFGLTQLGALFSMLSDLTTVTPVSQVCSPNNLSNTLAMLIRFSAGILCFGLAVYFVYQLYNNYLTQDEDQIK